MNRFSCLSLDVIIVYFDLQKMLILVVCPTFCVSNLGITFFRSFLNLIWILIIFSKYVSKIRTKTFLINWTQFQNVLNYCYLFHHVFSPQIKSILNKKKLKVINETIQNVTKQGFVICWKFNGNLN